MRNCKFKVFAAGVKALKRCLCLLDYLNTIVNGASVMRSDHYISYRLIAKLFGNLADCKEIAEGLTHLAVIYIYIAVMHPIVSKVATVCTFGLCDLVFVVWEDKVLTAAMNIDSFSEESACHSRAFNMPTGSAVAPRGLPIGLTRFCGFPKAEIHRRFLDFGYINTRTRLQILKGLMRELAVFVEFICSEIYIAI